MWALQKGKHDPGTLAEAFQGEYDVDGSHTAYALQAKEALIEQEEDIDLETALAPWNWKATLIWKKPMSKRYRWPAKKQL